MLMAAPGTISPEAEQLRLDGIDIARVDVRE
jgi:hypothetical protein